MHYVMDRRGVGLPIALSTQSRLLRNSLKNNTNQRRKRNGFAQPDLPSFRTAPMGLKYASTSSSEGNKMTFFPLCAAFTTTEHLNAAMTSICREKKLEREERRERNEGERIKNSENARLGERTRCCSGVRLCHSISNFSAVVETCQRYMSGLFPASNFSAILSTQQT